MSEKSFRITIHMVSSLDGFIAKNDNSVSWFDTTDKYENGIDGDNPEEFLKTIDCYVMGSKTYELALELSKLYGWAYGDKHTIVLTTRKLPVERTNVELYAGTLSDLIDDRLKPFYQNVWVVGGAMLTKEFIRLNLADEIRMTVLPILLGEGKLFFDRVGVEQPLHLKDVKAYRNGMVELCYEIKI